MFLRTLAFLPLVLLCACSHSPDSPKPTGRNVPLVLETTKESYLSGPEFCSLYTKITGKESGLRVSVPKDYAHPEIGSLSIYAYTLKPFDPTLPSYIYFDGGPGQNTHGLMPDYFDKTNKPMNEIRFDQRGLGCSAPATWDEYLDQSTYSSVNNIKDAELIRQAYGISKWTVYGVSYGTVPATMYGSKYASVTTAVVLEGVVGDTSMIHDADYKAEKLNLVLALLNPQERIGFSTLMLETDASGWRSPDSAAFQSYMNNSFYRDKGMSLFAEASKKFIHPDGTIARDVLSNLRQKMIALSENYPNAQQPGAVDERMNTIIFCKDLSARRRPVKTVEYSSATGFYSRTWDQKYADQDCNVVGVPTWTEQPYLPKNYPTPVSVYYFQGAHDGATLAKGALMNWQNVPQQKSFFMLAEKGGHNPNITRLESDNATLVVMETGLFGQAIRGEDISAVDILRDNAVQAGDEYWKLFTSPTDMANLQMIEHDIEGISMVPPRLTTEL